MREEKFEQEHYKLSPMLGVCDAIQPYFKDLAQGVPYTVDAVWTEGCQYDVASKVP